MTSPTPAATSKYAWREIPQLGLPKRPARERIADFLEVYGLYDERTAQEQAARCIQCPNPGCVNGCPLCNPIPDWIRLTAEGRFDEAASVLGSNASLAEICARLCPGERLCEESCILNGRSEPVAIRHIEQFLMERALAAGLVDVATPPPLGKSVAVVGSDPGALACADELAGLGYSVTVHDSTSSAGGLLFATMPEFKLEKSVLERRVALMRKRGVTFRLGRSFGPELSLERLRSESDAVYLALDCRQPRTLDVPGANLSGVVQALEFLLEHCSDAPSPISHSPSPIPRGGANTNPAGKRVVVLGGGDTAIDCARTAARRGAREVTVVYRREPAEMPCTPHEYENAVEEGIRFVFCAAPIEFLGNPAQELAAVRCARTRLVPASGQPGQRRAFEVLPEAHFELPAEIAILALGFDPMPLAAIPLLSGLAVTASGTSLVVDNSQQTSLPGVFAGGVLTSGPGLMLYAVRDGRRAAKGIHAFLGSLQPASM